MTSCNACCMQAAAHKYSIPTPLSPTSTARCPLSPIHNVNMDEFVRLPQVFMSKPKPPILVMLIGTQWPGAATWGSHTGELPATLTRPDRSVILLQKTPISIFVRSFYHSLIARFNRQGVGTPLSIDFVYSSTIERTFVVLSDCSIGSDRLTGSSPLGPFMVARRSSRPTMWVPHPGLLNLSEGLILIYFVLLVF
jgi:hypothetical protein